MMIDIHTRIADSLLKRLARHGYAMSKDTANDLANTLVGELGLVQFDVPGERWWATHIWSTEAGEIIEVGNQ